MNARMLEIWKEYFVSRRRRYIDEVKKLDVIIEEISKMEDVPHPGDLDVSEKVPE